VGKITYVLGGIRVRSKVKALSMPTSKSLADRVNSAGYSRTAELEEAANIGGSVLAVNLSLLQLIRIIDVD
jgi:hypothetical protein